MNQTNLLENMVKFDNKSRPKSKDDKDKKGILLIVYVLFMRVENELLLLSEVEYL